jgi:hypothetical protein
MVRQLRKGDSQNGLVLANGGVCTYQHVVILSSRPRRDGSPYPERNPLPDVITDVPVPTVDDQAEGEAIIEVSLALVPLCLMKEGMLIVMGWGQTYTVEFNRDGTPLRGYIVGRLKSNGHRFLANHGDTNTLQQLSSEVKEPIGRSGWVQPDSEKKGRNLFSFEKGVKL